MTQPTLELPADLTLGDIMRVDPSKCAICLGTPVVALIDRNRQWYVCRECLTIAESGTAESNS